MADLYTPSKIERLNNVKCITPPDVAIISEPIWSPNGKYYSCSFPSAFYVNTIDTKTQAELQNDAWEFESWSPDSQYFTLGYTGGLVSRQYMELAMMKYDGTGLTQLVNKAGYEIYISSYWSPNKKYIAYPTVIAISGSADIYLVIIDSKGEEIYKFDLQQLTKDKGVDPTSFNWSPDSKKLTFLGSYNMETPKEGWYILDIESGKISSPIPAGVICGWNLPEWSPNGQEFLIVAHDCKTYQWGDDFDDRIYTINSDGSDLKSLTDKSVGNAHWTPDGKSIVFDKYTNQGSEIFIMNADGTNQRNLFGNQSHLSFIQWITP